MEDKIKLNIVTLCSGYDAQCLALERLKHNYSDFDYELVAWADIDKIQTAEISRSQQYKMAGNSITIAPLYHIFRKLFVDKENENQQLTLF